MIRHLFYNPLFYYFLLIALIYLQRDEERGVKIRRVKGKEDSFIHLFIQRTFVEGLQWAKIGAEATVVSKTGIVPAFTELIV